MDGQPMALNQADQHQERMRDKNVRMKTWDECGIEEKVERLRSELVGVRYAIRRSHDTCERLRHHSHDALGHVVVPLVVVPLVDDNLATGTGFDWLA